VDTSARPARAVWPFVAITFGWSWLFWLPAVLVTAGWLELPGIVPPVLGVIAVFGPSVAAFGLTFRWEGKQGALRLWKRGWSWRHGRRWLVPVLLLLPGVTVLTVGAMALLGEPLQMQHALPLAMVVPVFLLIYLLSALPEEYGWRGYALDRLQARWGPLVSSVVLGVIWGLWHLPLHFIAGSVQEVIPVWQFTAQTVVLAVLYTWVYNHTSGSVLAAALLHAVGNISAATLPYWVSESGRLINFAILLVAVLVVVATSSPPSRAGASPRQPARS
jgi:uncharacterized protein